MAPPKTRIDRICVKCGAAFQVPPSILRRGPGHGRFCSPRCSNSGTTHPRWNGGRTVRPSGYVFVKAPDHPRAHNGYVFEHIIIAEKALGRVLPKGAVIHHVNESRSDNRSQNLVICENSSYHKLIHFRMRLIALGADPDTEGTCWKCQKVKALAEFYPMAGRPNGRDGQCAECHRQK